MYSSNSGDIGIGNYRKRKMSEWLESKGYTLNLFQTYWFKTNGKGNAIFAFKNKTYEIQGSANLMGAEEEELKSAGFKKAPH